MLSGEAAAGVADAYALGTGAVLEGPVARGQLGRVWRLRTDGGDFAVKEWYAGPDPEVPESDALLSERARAAGVFTPRVVRSRSGHVVATVGGTQVRVHEWVDLAEQTRRLDPVAVGSLVAGLHSVGQPVSERPGPWFSEGISGERWRALLADFIRVRAPFAEELEALLDDLIEVESVVTEPDSLQDCHRDLWADNILPAGEGRICVVDFENHGPADPAHELAMVLYEFGDDEADRVRSLVTGYRATGGRAEVSRRRHFTMLVAEQSHISELAGRRWLTTDPGPERDRLAAWFREVLEDPVTIARIDRILAAVATAVR